MSASTAMDWQPMETAPRDGTCFLALIDGAAHAIVWISGLLDSNDRDCGGWAIADDEDPPESWTDGVCWAVNGEGLPSSGPTGWKPFSQDATP